MTAPGGEVYAFLYDSLWRLEKVRYPDATADHNADNPVRTYHYEDTRFPNALTGITDENGARYATWQYDSAGRAIVSTHADDAERVKLTYHSDGTTTVAALISHGQNGGNDLVRTQTFRFTTIEGVVKPVQIDGGPCESCGGQAQS